MADGGKGKKPKGPGRGKGGGRPKADVDERQVEQLAQINCSMDEIATIVGCSVSTLSRRFGEVIKKGRANMRASLKRNQYVMAVGRPAVYDDNGRLLQEALKPDKGMLIWLGKVVLGQVEASKLELTGRDGGPIEVEHDRDAIRAELDSRMAGIAARISPSGVVRRSNGSGAA